MSEIYERKGGGGLLFPYFAAAAGALSRKIICEHSVGAYGSPATFKMTHELRPGIFFYCAPVSENWPPSPRYVRVCTLGPHSARKRQRWRTENRRNANFMFFVNLGMQEDRARGDKKKSTIVKRPFL